VFADFSDTPEDFLSVDKDLCEMSKRFLQA